MKIHKTINRGPLSRVRFISLAKIAAAWCAVAVMLISSTAQAQNLFVVSDADNYIHEITPDRTQTYFAYAYYSQGMAFDSRGNLFVSVAGNNTIIEFTNNAGALSSIETRIIG